MTGDPEVIGSSFSLVTTNALVLIGLASFGMPSYWEIIGTAQMSCVFCPETVHSGQERCDFWASEFQRILARAEIALLGSAGFGQANRAVSWFLADSHTQCLEEVAFCMPELL